MIFVNIFSVFIVFVELINQSDGRGFLSYLWYINIYSLIDPNVTGQSYIYVLKPANDGVKSKTIFESPPLYTQDIYTVMVSQNFISTVIVMNNRGLTISTFLFLAAIRSDN